MAAATFGVYVHIPFCASKCDYCAFATWTAREHLVDGYLHALRTEIFGAVDLGLATADTVFVGGGTPTLVSGDALAEVIAAIPVTDGAEITVECNPDDVSLELLRTYRDAGVNRVSLFVGHARAVARPARDGHVVSPVAELHPHQPGRRQHRRAGRLRDRPPAGHRPEAEKPDKGGAMSRSTCA